MDASIQNASQTSIDTTNTTNKEEINELREEIRRLKLETNKIYAAETPESTPSSSRNHPKDHNSFRHNSVAMFMKRRNHAKIKYTNGKSKYE